MQEQILILDFGSQFTQLIARRLREMNVYCEIHPFNKIPALTPNIKGVILSGSPHSVRQENPLNPSLENIKGKLPLLGICYGAQLTTKQYGGKVEKSSSREYGRAQLCNISHNYALTDGIEEHNQVWMSHADTILTLAPDAEVIAQTESIPVAAFSMKNTPNPLVCLQFHPEVTHSQNGKQIIENFVVGMCGSTKNWTPASYIEETIATIQNKSETKKSSWR